jgi:hypothetical protein
MRIISGLQGDSCKHVSILQKEGGVIKTVFADSAMDNGMRFLSWNESTRLFTMTVYEEGGNLIIQFKDYETDGVVDQITVLKGSPSSPKASENHFREVLVSVGNRIL